MEQSVPLLALLSRALVAYTIEFDNEFEHLMPHRTTNFGLKGGARLGPWLVSLAMYSNCMAFVNEQGVPVRELESLARTPTNLKGMIRWRYVTVAPDPADKRPKPPPRDYLIRPTVKGREAQNVWTPLFGVIEERWRDRFGKDEINQLRKLLQEVVVQADPNLPDCLPILGYGLYHRRPDNVRNTSEARPAEDIAGLPLSALLSRLLLTFALEFEQESAVSLAICANVLRLAGEEGMRVRDLTRAAGVSKEAISMSLNFLQKRQYAEVVAETAGSKIKALKLTAKGRFARGRYFRLVSEIEERWVTRLGKETVLGLREVLSRLDGDGSSERSPLFLGLKPYPDGWRASVQPPERLPHFPMVLHRGGFPDGS